MPDELDLMQLASAGELLATLDDTEYRAVSVVFAWNDGGAPIVYCASDAWPHTLPARLAAKDKAIAELEDIADRHASEAVKQAQRAASAEAEIAVLQSRLKTLEQHLALPTEPIICPDCGRDGWKSAAALQMHKQRAHQGMQAGRRQQSDEVAEDAGWRCKVKGCNGAYTRSLLEPDFCTYHAKPAQLNGHAPLVEARDD